MSDIVLRDYQIECVNKLKRYLNIPYRGVVSMMCGTGKTVIIKELIKIASSKISMIIVPSLILVDQVFTFMFDLLGFSVRTVCSKSGNYNLTSSDEIYKFLNSNKNKKVLIVCYKSMDKIQQLVDDYEVTINNTYVDEAHHLETSTKANWIKELSMKEYFKSMIFFTATPTQNMNNGDYNYAFDGEEANQDDIDEGEYTDIAFRYTLNQAIKDNYIVPYKLVFMIYFTPENETDQIITQKIIADALIYTMQKLKLRKMVTFHRKVKGGSVLPGSSSQEFHKLLNEIKPNEDFKLFHIDGDTSNTDRNVMFSLYKSCKHAILSSCKTMSEGIDIPCIDSIFINDPKFSEIDCIQTIGRPLRLHDDKKEAHIIVPINGNVFKSDFPKDLMKTQMKTFISIVRALRNEDVDFDTIFQDEKWETKMDQYISIVEHGKLETVNLDLNFIKSYIKDNTRRAIQRARVHFDVNLQAIKEYYEKYGKFPSEHTGDPKTIKLGTFIRNLKRSKRYNMGIESELKRRIEKIEEMFPNWKWDKSSPRQLDIEKVQKLKDFIEEYGDMPRSKSKRGRTNENACVNIRTDFRDKYNRGVLNPDTIKDLESIESWTWYDKSETQDYVNQIAEMLKILESGTTLPLLKGSLKNSYNNMKKSIESDRYKLLVEALMHIPGYTYKCSNETDVGRSKYNYTNTEKHTKENIQVAALKIKNIFEANNYEFNYIIPEEIKLPSDFVYFDIKDLQKEIKPALKTKEYVKRYVTEHTPYTKVNVVEVRGYNQKIFRHNTLVRFGFACVITGISEKCILDACHIKPFSEFDNKDDSYEDNGLLMASHFHKLYDNFKFSINSRGQIRYYKGLDPLITQYFRDGDRVRTLNLNFNNREKQYLKEHYQKFLDTYDNEDDIVK